MTDCPRRFLQTSFFGRMILVLGCFVGNAGCQPAPSTGEAARESSSQGTQTDSTAPVAKQSSTSAADADKSETAGEQSAAAPSATVQSATVQSAATDSSKAQPPAPFQPPLPAEELADGWISLFDGQTLFGWRAVTEANWQVQDGAITVSEGEPGLLCSGVPWSNYEFQVEFRFAPGTNSGIFLHSPLRPQDPTQDCYELNIAEPAVSPFPTGSFVGREKGAEEAGRAAPDTWHRYTITVEGGHLTVQLNGQPALDYTDPQPLGRGYIGLQLNKGAVAFRNLKLRPLGLQPLFNGRDLAGWKEYPHLKSRFSVTSEGELRVQDGRGQLETVDQFGDFVLQLECKTNARLLNSGLFFRCVPGQEMLGYESQIHNGVRDGDRTKPLDFGTGGIFRRIPARQVAADDLEWFTKTINAAGPDIAVWVNGYQVTQWTDDRAPDENPRKGLRTAAGTLQIQGHDPTTDLVFRRLRAAELAARRGD